MWALEIKWVTTLIIQHEKSSLSLTSHSPFTLSTECTYLQMKQKKSIKQSQLTQVRKGKMLNTCLTTRCQEFPPICSHTFSISLPAGSPFSPEQSPIGIWASEQNIQPHRGHFLSKAQIICTHCRDQIQLQSCNYFLLQTNLTHDYFSPLINLLPASNYFCSIPYTIPINLWNFCRLLSLHNLGIII